MPFLSNPSAFDKNKGIRDAFSTVDITDCHRLPLVVYLWSTCGLVVSHTVTDHHRMLLNALISLDVLVLMVTNNDTYLVSSEIRRY